MQISKNTVKELKPFIQLALNSHLIPSTEAKAVEKILWNATKASGQNDHLKAPLPKRMLTAKQVAERLGVCVKTVLRLNKDEQLKGRYLTGSKKSLRFNQADVNDFIDNKNN